MAWHWSTTKSRMATLRDPSVSSTTFFLFRMNADLYCVTFLTRKLSIAVPSPTSFFSVVLWVLTHRADESIPNWNERHVKNIAPSMEWHAIDFQKSVAIEKKYQFTSHLLVSLDWILPIRSDQTYYEVGV